MGLLEDWNLLAQAGSSRLLIGERLCLDSADHLQALLVLAFETGRIAQPPRSCAPCRRV
jgi:hypothetical protein